MKATRIFPSGPSCASGGIGAEPKKLFICINQSWTRKARPVPRAMLGAPSSVCYNFSSSLNPFPCFVSLLPAGTNEWRSSRPCCEAIWDRSLILVQRATVEDGDDNHPWGLTGSSKASALGCLLAVLRESLV